MEPKKKHGVHQTKGELCEILGYDRRDKQRLNDFLWQRQIVNHWKNFMEYMQEFDQRGPTSQTIIDRVETARRTNDDKYTVYHARAYDEESKQVLRTWDETEWFSYFVFNVGAFLHNDGNLLTRLGISPRDYHMTYNIALAILRFLRRGHKINEGREAVIPDNTEYIPLASRFPSLKLLGLPRYKIVQLQNGACFMEDRDGRRWGRPSRQDMAAQDQKEMEQVFMPTDPNRQRLYLIRCWRNLKDDGRSKERFMRMVNVACCVEEIGSNLRRKKKLTHKKEEEARIASLDPIIDDLLPQTVEESEDPTEDRLQRVMATLDQMAAPSSEETEFAKMAKAFMDGLAEGGIGLDKALKLFGLERNINPKIVCIDFQA